MDLYKTSLLILFLLFVLIFLGAPNLVYADGTDCPANTICIKNPLKYESVPEIIKEISELLKVVALGIGVIMIIYGGIMIMTAAGSEEKVTKGKKTLMWTVIGVAIVYLVDFLVGFIKEILTGL